MVILPGHPIKALKGTHLIPEIWEMRRLANRIGSELKAGDILLLTGELGSGKTTFAQSLGTELQVEQQVTSPTFTVMAEYDVPSSHIFNQLVHIDLYRLGNPISAEDQSHIDEIINMAPRLRRLVVIEWADYLCHDIQKPVWRLQFEHGSKETERLVTVHPPTKGE